MIPGDVFILYEDGRDRDDKWRQKHGSSRHQGRQLTPSAKRRVLIEERETEARFNQVFKKLWF